MKKLFYIAFGLCAILASCAKEIDPIPAENPGNNEKTVLPANIPASLTALYAEEASQNEVEAVPKVKTSYGSDGSFSWVLNDEVALYFVDNLDAPENQGWISYEASTVNGATATFTVKDGQTAKATALSEYKNTGLAIYPTSIARPASANSESCSAYGSPFVTVKSTVSGNASDIILIGSADATPVFHFKTAMGVLKVTITGIPAQAAALQLISNDQDSYPLCGDFKLNIDGDLEIKKADYLKYYGYHTGADKLTIDLSSEGDIASRDFYFNIPTGNYAKGAFTIKIVDGSGNALLEKTLNKAFEFERNDLVSTPSALANEWVTLGTGKYADYWMQGYKDVVEDMWSVTVQKSTTGRTYRISNPYAQGINLTQTSTHDDYLYFTINNDKSISFVNHITGVLLEYNSTSYNTMLYYNSESGHQNKVLVGEADTPEIIQLAPVYKDKDSESFKNSRHKRNYMIRLVMPDYVNKYVASSVTTSGYANQLTGNFTVPTDVKTIFFLSTKNYPKYIVDTGDSDINPVAGSFSTLFWPGRTGTGSISYNESSMTAQSFASGPLYLCWCTYEGSYSPIYTLGSIPFYYINPTDASSRCGQYSYSSGTVLPAALSSKKDEVTVSLAISNDSSKGNMMITEFCGYYYKIDYSTATSGVVTQGTTGNPIYGEYKSSQSSLDNNPGIISSNTFNQLFFKDSSGYNYYLGGGTDNNSVGFVFDYNGHDLTCWDDHLKLYYFSSSYDKIHLTNFVADRSLINKCTLETNSTSGSDVISKIADGDPESFWESVWSGTRPWDETYGVYFTIGLPSPLKSAQLKFRIRPSNNNGTPRAFKYWTSTNGSTWTPYSVNEVDATNDVTSSGAMITLPEVTASDSFNYIRVRVVKAGTGEGTVLSSSAGFTAISELQLSGSAE